MQRKDWALGLILVVFAVQPVACHTKAPEVAPGPPADAHLSDAAPSIDALLDQFVAAVGAKDMQALTRLRVTEAEYRNIIIPGNVPLGHAPRTFPEKTSKFTWSLNDTKSIYWEGALLGSFGGHQYTRKEVKYGNGIEEYAWFKAYKRVELTLVDETGREVELRTGSIAEVNGRYKFLSFAGGG